MPACLLMRHILLTTKTAAGLLLLVASLLPSPFQTGNFISSCRNVFSSGALLMADTPFFCTSWARSAASGLHDRYTHIVVRDRW
jgi:hypothetical protein